MTEAKVKIGQWVIVFGTAAQILAVADSTAFPGRALQLLLKTVGGETTTTLVPVDYEPWLVPWAATPTPTGPPPARRWD